MKIGIIVHPARIKEQFLNSDVYPVLSRAGLSYELIPRGEQGASLKRMIQKRRFDVIMALGGDGTFLSASRIACPLGLPVLGVNAGGYLGFISQIDVSQLGKLADRLRKGTYGVETRLVLVGTVTREGKRVLSSLALNDVIVSHATAPHLVSLKTYVSEEYLTTYDADGVIVSTATGSTAYSLSAGGPIIAPSLRVLVLTPVCPHSLNQRPLVVPATEKIAIEVLTGKETPVTISFDGQVFSPLDISSRVEVKAYSKPLKIIKLEEPTFFQTLQDKLQWGLPPSVQF